MEFGVGLPGDLHSDVIAIRDFVQAVDGAGFTYLNLPDHVVGTPRGGREAVQNAAFVRPGAAEGRYQGIYTDETVVHEPLILASHVLALTKQIRCVTAILILAQRQAVLVAKQSAELAVLSGERFTLGVGVGYQPWEFEALDVPYESRGARYEEQIDVMRRLWAQPTVTFEGRFHRLHEVGINPRPASGRIPVWMGGGGAADPVGVPAPARRILARIGRMGDGWNIAANSFADYAERRDIIRDAARKAGRDPMAIAINHSLTISDRPLGEQLAYARRWAEAGVTHAALSVSPLAARSPDERIGKLVEFRDAFQSA